jgi:thiamine biosynthesis lipoprotein
MHRHEFTAMGTRVECFSEAERVTAGIGFGTVEREFARLEQLLSRFLPDSELSRLNRDRVIEAGAELLELVVRSLDARQETGGRFDPTVLNALVAAGYDRTFELVGSDCAGTTGSLRPGGGRVSVDRRSGRIELHGDARLDLGGIAKGWAVDRACGLLAEHGACLINAGGDIAARGLARDGAWPVGLETPGGERVLGLSSGAMATSGSDRRRWRQGGALRHHLIDPATGSPARSNLLRVTVVASSATQAEVWAKALFLSGAQDAVEEAAARGLECVVVTTDGCVLETAGLA